MPFEITGKVVEVMPVTQVSDKFRKREFVIEKKETGGGAVFIDYIKFQLVQDKCEMINESFLHDEVKVLFNIKGNRWEKEGKVNYFTNLDAWKIERSSSQNQEQQFQKSAPREEFPPEDSEMSDLPF
jgi:hypothetical protein